jgi:hypothetical protein
MKLIRPNSSQFFLKACLGIACIFASCSCYSQTTYSDTTTVEVVDTVADTSADEQPNYFDSKNTPHNADTIEFRHVPPTVMDSLKNDDAFWYANTRVKKKEQRVDNNGNTTPVWVKNLIWIVIVGTFLAALIWYLTASNILVFSKAQKHISTGNDTEEISEDIFAINYQQELEKAMAAEDYRLAVRLMFLRLLRNLSNKNIIQYKQGRTNFEYLSQLFPTGYYNDFFRLTRTYEYAWYGKFDVSPDAFRTIRSDFENFDHRLR